MEDASPQQLTLVIQASNKAAAQQVLDDLKLQCLTDSKITPIGELYLIEAATNQHLTDEEYGLIRDNNNIAILRDSDSQQRGKEILNKIHDVEIRLRTLLVYTPDITGQFHTLLVKTGKYIQGYNHGDITKSQLDPIVGHLTLGEMVSLLGIDLSIKNSNDKKILWQEIEKILASADDFESFKKQINNKLEQRFVWDIISEKVLKTPIKWNDVKKPFDQLVKARNIAAHFHVITDKKKKESLKLADEILSKTAIKTRVKKEDAALLSSQLTSLSSQLASFSFVPSISGWASIAQQQIATMDFSAINQSIESIKEMASRINPYGLDYFGLSNPIVDNVASSLSSNLKIMELSLIHI